LLRDGVRWLYPGMFPSMLRSTRSLLIHCRIIGSKISTTSYVQASDNSHSANLSSVQTCRKSATMFSFTVSVARPREFGRISTSRLPSSLYPSYTVNLTPSSVRFSLCIQSFLSLHLFPQLCEYARSFLQYGQGEPPWTIT
jgi:hypothetical protein